MAAAPLVNFRRLSVRTPWWMVWAAVVPVVLFRIVRALVRHRSALPPLLMAAGVWWAWSRFGFGLLVGLVLVAVSVAGWWWRWPGSCRRLVLWPALSRWRRLWVYRRQWVESLTGCGLVKTFDTGRQVPTLVRVRCTSTTDEVTVRMLRGQNPEHWHTAAVNLAHAFDTRQCRVYSTRRDLAPVRSGRLAWLLRAVDRVRYVDRPRLVTLVFIRRDALTQLVDPFPVPAVPDFTALPLALREDLQPYHLRLLATHVLVAGATRMGKGSVIWSLVRALAGGIRSGLVRVWAIDPKGGMELALGRRLFARYCDDEPAAMADLLDAAVGIMRERQARLRGVVRVHTPTTDDPLVLVLVDELAALIAYQPDSELRARMAGALSLLLSQGAGLGVLVLAAVQDPWKEVVSFRDLFPTRIALGVTERSQVDMVLGDGARNRGALADQIPVTAKGVGYVLLDGQPEPARVRFSYVSDDLIRAMSGEYPAPAEPGPTPAPAAEVKPLKAPKGKAVYRPTGRAASGPLLPQNLLDALGDGEPA